MSQAHYLPSDRVQAFADALESDNDFPGPETRRKLIESARAIRPDDPTRGAVDRNNLAHNLKMFLGAERPYVDLTIQDAARLVLAHVEANGEMKAPATDA